MKEITFTNLEGNNLNRRKITVLKQNGNEILADIEFAGEVNNEATPITAEIMEEFQSNINNALSKSEDAINQFSKVQKLEEDILRQVEEKLGSVVYEKDVAVPTFNADTKLNVAQGEENVNKVMVTDQNGKVVPSSAIYIGGYKLYSKDDAETGKSTLIIEFPNEEE